MTREDIEMCQITLKLIFCFNLCNRLGSLFVIPAFFVRKIGYIYFVPKSVCRLSVRPCLCPSITFLVIVSSPKPLDVATSNFVDA